MTININRYKPLAVTTSITVGALNLRRSNFVDAGSVAGLLEELVAIASRR